MTVTVRLRSEGRKLLAHAVFATEAGDLVIDYLYIKYRPGFDTPRVELPGRPDRGVFRPVIHLPPSWFAALVAAVERELSAS